MFTSCFWGSEIIFRKSAKSIRAVIDPADNYTYTSSMSGTKPLTGNTKMNTYTVIVGNDPAEQAIEASSAQDAAEKGVRQYRGERSMFATECGTPAVIVDGVEFTPAAYATSETNTYDA